ncbi:MAG: LysR family transcriptional regulator [Coriobacteriales bacterium]|nr:LysR family transcriptional regulator [Coriobacteriales bacterium]
MELEQLRQLDVIVRCGTLQAAAEHLHLSQSALSRSLRRLEDDLGQPLFDRTRNSMQINAAGRMALDHARLILAEERRMRDDFAALAKRERTVRVASVAPAPTWRLSSLVLVQYPTIIVEPDIVRVDDIEERLLNGTCDLAITAQEPNLPTIVSSQFMQEDLYANVPRGHALYDHASLTFAELDGLPFLVYGGIGFWHDIHTRMLPTTQFVTQPDRTIFLQQVRTSNLLTFTTNAPENTSRHESRRAIPITDPEARATFWLCRRTDAPELIRVLFELADEPDA